MVIFGFTCLLLMCFKMNSDDFKCEDCNKFLNSRKGLQNHSRVHKRCLQCGNKFKTKSDLKSHDCTKTTDLVKEFENTSCLPHPETKDYCKIKVHRQLKHRLNVNFGDLNISFKDDEAQDLKEIYAKIKRVFENVLYVLEKRAKKGDLFKFVLQTSDIQR